MLFSDRNYDHNFTINLQNDEIERVNNFNYLGITLDHKLTWKEQIENMTNKLCIAAGILNKPKYYVPVPQSVLVQTYYGITYSHLKYAITSWGNSSKTLLSKLQITQIRIIKILSQVNTRKVRLLPLYNKLNQLKLNSVYQLKVIKFMVKVKFKELPEAFTNYFHLSSNVHSYNTRHAKSESYYIPRFNKVKSQRSITVTGSKLWNKLPQEIKNKL